MRDHGFLMVMRQLQRDHSLLFAGLAIVTIFVCFMLTLITPLHGTHNIYPMIFTPVILAAAWYAGTEWGLLSTVLASIFLIYFVLEPVHSFTVSTLEDFERLAAFMAVGACISWGASLQRRTCDMSVTNANILRITLANIRDAVIITDANGRISVMNALAETLTDWPMRSAIGQRLASVFHLLHEESRDGIHVRYAEHDGVIPLPERAVLVARDGAEVIVEASATVIHHGFQASQVVLVFRNVNSQRQSEQVNSEKAITEEFLGLVSHELRTPLTSILGWARGLRESRRIDESLKVGLSSIDRNARLQLQLIEDLLDVSRIAIGSFRLHRKAVDANTIVTSAVENIRVAVHEKRIRLAVMSEPGLVINADPGRLHQVVWNLLSNAVKFTNDGGWIEVTCKKAGQALLIQVQDNGRGFPSQFQSRLFQRFQQSDRLVSKHGVGLGLLIVRHIVELHGGRVEGRSDGLYKGATFIVTLPVKHETMTARAAQPK